MMTDQEIKALVERLRGNADSHGRGMPLARRITGDHLSAAADTIEALSAKVAELTIQLRVVRLDRDGAVKRMEAAEKRLAEVEAVQKAKDDQYWLVAENEAKLQEHCDRLESAARRQVQNIEHWLETDEPASPEESRSIYEQLKGALSGSSDPRKDVARRCVEILRGLPGDVDFVMTGPAGILQQACCAITSEFSLDTKDGTDAGE